MKEKMSERVDQAEVNSFGKLDSDCFSGSKLESLANGYFEDLTKGVELYDEHLMKHGLQAIEVDSEMVARRAISLKSNQNAENETPFGVMLIFNTRKHNVDSEPRMGSSMDALRCEETWRQLGFDVYVYQDLRGNKWNDNRSEIMGKIDHFLEKAKHFKWKAFGVTLMGHGDSEGNIATFASTELKISDLLNKVQPSQSLKNVPKLFFIQACRGGKQMQKVALTNPEQTPLRADTVVHYSTYQGYGSSRQGVKKILYSVNSFCLTYREF